MFCRSQAIWGLAAALSFGFSDAHAATIVTDQVNDGFLTNSSISTGFMTSRAPWQQEILAGVTGQLVGLDVFMFGAGPLTVSVNVGSPLQTDPNDFTASILGIATTQTSQHLDLTSANIYLAAGDAYILSISGANQGFPPTVLALGTRDTLAGGLYAGRLFNSGSVYDQSNGGRFDLGFRTYMRLPDPSATVTPEPTSLALAGFAGVGMVIGAWRRRRQPA